MVTKPGYHLIVLAKNYHGYKNLIKLVSRTQVDGFICVRVLTVKIWRNITKI